MRRFFAGAAFWYLTTLIALVAGVFGATLLHSPRVGATPADVDVIARLAGGDGVWYSGLAEHGYQRTRGPFSNAAFFPAFPVAARYLAWVTSLRTDIALLIVANLCFLAVFLAVAAYSRRRHDMPTGVTDYTLLALGLLPTSWFFRAAYSESMLLLLVVLVLYAMDRDWSWMVLVVLVGLATATRPVGIALLPPFAWYAWRRLGNRRLTPSVLPTRAIDDHGQHPWQLWEKFAQLARIAPLVAIACWGLVAFSVFLWFQFGDAFAFVGAQVSCRLTLAPDVSLPRKLLALVALEPIWSVYVPSRLEYWARYQPHTNPLFSLQFANPIYFVGTVALVILGWRKKWLTEYEVLLSVGLLVIPYVTKSHDNAMASFGRFSAVVLPAYIVMGHLLYRLGPALAAALFAVSAFFLGVYSAMFAAGHRFI